MSTKPAASKDIPARIIAGALDVLRKDGMLALTQPRVAKAAKVRQSHLTYYFPTRSDLLAVVFAAVSDRLLGAFDANRPGDLSRIASPEQTRLLLGLVLTADREPAVRKLFRDLTTKIRRRITESLAESGVGSDSATVAMMHALGVGLAVLDLARQEPGSRRELKTTRAFVVKALKRSRRKK